MGNTQAREIEDATKGGLITALADDLPDEGDEPALTSTPTSGKANGNLSEAVKPDYLDQAARARAEPVDLPFTLGRTLGQGAFGQVKLGVHVKTKDRVAIKIIPKAKLVGPGAVGNMEREIKMMKLLRHENVVRLYDVVVARTKVYLAMEYADGGDMLAFVNSRKQLTEPEAAALFGQVVAGVNFCHKLGVCHRDLKLENLLLCDGTVKIADFGLANYAPPPTIAGSSFMETHCGSPLYAAPELLRNQEAYDATKVDVWSLGVVLYALVCRKLPFEGETLPAILKKIVGGDYALPTSLSPQLTALIRAMLAVDPAVRPSADEVESHEWLRMHAPAASVEEGGGIKASFTLGEMSEEISALQTSAALGATVESADGRRRPTTMSAADLKREVAEAREEQAKARAAKVHD
ncbi:hypothetical protein KFE25_007300 [Diacronema lutheri]|uniref:Protein kinase domain-containing protein n=1 Tax=Diacronema lutheri TaxID=2081491 RepID=A0A8J5XUS5_DIALT|nr:hypothetical protein KFE25_007300 [Diacronema lutheri]